jgi:hypothetical protein
LGSSRAQRLLAAMLARSMRCSGVRLGMTPLSGSEDPSKGRGALTRRYEDGAGPGRTGRFLCPVVPNERRIGSSHIAPSEALHSRLRGLVTQIPIAHRSRPVTWP